MRYLQYQKKPNIHSNSDVRITYRQNVDDYMVKFAIQDLVSSDDWFSADPRAALD